MNVAKRLYKYYEAYHAHGRARLQYMGYFGLASLVLLYLPRFTRPDPQPFDDLAPRLVGMALFAGLALREKWPEHWQRYYLPFSYAALLYCLPCFTVLLALQRGGGTPSISNALIALCFLMLLTDWRNTIAMLVGGVLLALAINAASGSPASIPVDLVRQIPAFAVIVLGGNLFKFSSELIEAERRLKASAVRSLAGSIAHEMRNALGQVNFYLESAQAALQRSADSQDMAALLAQGKVAVRRGSQVISMTLDAVNSKPLDPATFARLDAADVCRKAVADYGYEDEDQRGRITVEVRSNFSFLGDETAFTYVLFNLIKNSLYYLSAYPNARIRVTVDRPCIKVRDTGPGIAPDVLKQLFQAFKSHGKKDGTGLGLSYCHRIVTALEGTIRCESVQGEYTEFVMTFPTEAAVQKPPAPSPVIAERARRMFAGKKILVVDDDRLILRGMVHKLSDLGASIQEAHGGKKAVEHLQAQCYDLALVDLRMPDHDGFWVADQLRTGDSASRNTCLIAHTGEPHDIVGHRVKQVGFDGFIGKPCSQTDLLARMMEFYGRKEKPAASCELPLAGRRIVVADDSSLNRRAAAVHLRHAGAEVIEAASGEEVIEKLGHSRDWFAVLLDLHMPGISGVETARLIRSRFGGNSLTVVGLSADSNAESMEAAREAGMNDWITKPLDGQALIGMLLRHAQAAEHGHETKQIS